MWQPRVFYGSSPADVFNEAFIEGLSNSILLPSIVYSPGYSAGPGQFLYYCIPAPYTAVPGDFRDAETGFAVGMSMVANGVPVTNAFGVTLLYDVWQSDVANLGPITVNVGGC